MKEINLDNPIGAEKARQLPDPKGYRMLIMLPQMEEKTEGGVILPEDGRPLLQRPGQVPDRSLVQGRRLGVVPVLLRDPDQDPQCRVPYHQR